MAKELTDPECIPMVERWQQEPAPCGLGSGHDLLADRGYY